MNEYLQYGWNVVDCGNLMFVATCFELLIILKSLVNNLDFYILMYMLIFMLSAYG